MGTDLEYYEDCKLFVAGNRDADDMRPWMLVNWSVHMTEFTYSWGPLLKQKEGKESIGGAWDRGLLK